MTYKRTILVFILIIFITILIGGIADNISYTTQLNSLDLKSLEHRDINLTISTIINGNWTITDETVIEGEEYIIIGNVTIENGGALILKNSVLKIYSLSYDHPYGIHVKNGGNLTIIDSVIRPYTENYHITS